MKPTRSRVRSSKPNICTVLSRGHVGLAAPLVRVEVHLGTGLPAFFMVGLPEAVVRESKERVRSAVLSAGYEFPAGRITVNLSPADLPKHGARYDLPIAAGILAASGQLAPESLAGLELYGELSLGGELRETPGLLPALIAGSAAGAELIVPAANALEATVAAGGGVPLAGIPRCGIRLARIRLAHRLVEVCQALSGGRPLPSAPPRTTTAAPATCPDLAEVNGQFAAKRALEIAAAGGHGLLMIGPPGAGKSLLAQRLPGLLPPLDPAEAMEVASLESAAGRRPSWSGLPPFRSPQHTASVAALIGGAAFRPGELSLAHLGVLFLDELPEFARNVLEALREPLESGVVVLSRARRACEFPARFQLVAAMNPCPCGHAGDPRGRCRCTGAQVARYRNRLSGPLIDRIDMHVELAALPVDHLMGSGPLPETSAVVAARVAAARAVQIARQGKLNSRLTPGELKRLCPLRSESRGILSMAITRLGLSARAYHRVLKVARSCADLAAAPDIRAVDVSEAVQLRALDRATC